MTTDGQPPLPLVDGLRLPAAYRQALRPDEAVIGADGLERRLPRFFYAVDSWETAKRTFLAPHFCLHELIQTDLREARILHGFPRYVPCAMTLLAAHLQVLRDRCGKPIHVAANGGYRSPAHQRSRPGSTHCWGAAVDVYRIGDEYLDRPETIARYAEVARAALPGAWVRPWGNGAALDDHLHLDLGYVVQLPRELP